ncbi:MAG: acetate/propionate family kinase [Planctomycetota bacterium]|jgi:acetate kinase
MSEMILTINAGSSSVKFAVFDAGAPEPELVARGQVEGIGTAPHFVARDAEGHLLAESYWESVGGGGHARAFRQIEQWLPSVVEGRPLLGVGHRVVHGGTRYTQPVLIDDEVIAELTRLVPLVPLHQPHHLAAIRAVADVHPEVPQVACFDTAFHQDRPEVSTRLGLPFEMHERGVRRYGFHGLSYEYIASRLASIAPDLVRGRVVVAHLGSGSSMCAIRDGRTVETSMGFSGLDGLPMGTRCGALDPGVPLFLLGGERMPVQDLEDLLYKRSGLLGISGVSNDMRALRASDDPRARDAIDFYVYRIGQELGALTASLGGLDALVFTAGVGEHDADLRAAVCRDAAWLGVEIDEAANEQHAPRISAGDTSPSVWVIPTDEERMIAMHTGRLLAGGATAARREKEPTLAT